jgi:hypothetical protein
MSKKAKTEYLIEIKKRYLSSSKAEKQIILNEFCKVCGYNRKYAIRLINKPGTNKKKSKKPGRPKTYNNPLLLEFIKRIWICSNLACSKRLKAMIPFWLPFYDLSLEEDVKNLLLSISPATIDRILSRIRRKHKKFGLSTTKPGSLLKKHIPIKTNQWDESRPGFLEADTVAHCGSSLSGSFIYTVNVTDIATGWTESRASWGKGQIGVFDALKAIESSLPFKILGFDSDNGNEFLNNYLWAYLTKRKVHFTRSREYQKNDNAHIEQKNWTLIRQYLGYHRFDNPEMLPLLNKLYTNQWPLFFNFFLPSTKLLDKKRDGSKLIKKYDMPKTPFLRILESQHIKTTTKNKLIKLYKSLNPFLLHKSIKQQITNILNLI